MKRTITLVFLSIVIVLGISNFVNGQVEVFTDNSVLISDYLEINKNPTGLNPYVRYNITGAASNLNAFGSEIRIDGTTDDRKLLLNLSVDTTKNEFLIDNYSASITENFKEGLRTRLFGTARSAYGVYNFFDVLKDSSATLLSAYGTYNFINQNDSRLCIGSKNFIEGGLANLSNYKTTGTENIVDIRSIGFSYGSHNVMFIYNSVNSGEVYGVRSRIANKSTAYAVNGTPHKVYGIYSHIDPNFNGYAGYFIGDVHVEGHFSHTSDERLKYGVKDVESALELIAQLKPKSYKMLSEKENQQKRDQLSYGFLAQELMEVFPDLVTLVDRPGTISSEVIVDESIDIGPNGEEIVMPSDINYSEDMNGEARYAVSYIELIPFLVKAIQEQSEQMNAIETSTRSIIQNQGNEEIEVLKKQLAKTESKYQLLESKLQQLIDCTDCDELSLDLRTDAVELDLSALTLKIYPNPVTNILNLEAHTDETGIMEISIFDASGQRIAHDKTMLLDGKNVHKMNVSDWASGNYYVTTTFQGVTKSNKVVVE